MTVIEARVHRSTARNAKIGGFLTVVFTGFLSAAVLSQWLAPILSGLAGLAIGLACGAIVWAAIRIWPFVRICWWWTGELAAVTAIGYGWVWLTRTPFPVIVTTMTLLAATFLLGRVRRVTAAIGWCFVVRHRLRTCFAQFIVANQSGTLPLIFIARPTPVGERVWIYLRPGLSPSDLESRLEKIAVACHASAVLVERASARTAGLLRVDIKRREVLGGMVGSPLPAVDPVDQVDTVTADDPFGDINSVWARADLSSVPDAPVSPAPASAPAQTASRPSPATVKVPTILNGSGEDLTDYI